MKNLAIILTIFSFAIILRIFDFQNRINFGPEQAISLLTSAGYLLKPTLLGQPYYHQTSTGLIMFYGPQFNYILVPFLLIFKFNPVPITFLFTILNLVTAVVIYWLSKKISNSKVAIIATIFFVFNSTMINHSFFIWGLHFFPIMGFVSFYLLTKYKFSRHQNIISVIVGLVTGFGVSLEYPYAVYGLITFISILFLSRKKLMSGLVFLVGCAVGDLPMILFDLRHNFYYTQVLLHYFQDQQSRLTHTLDYFHFLPIWGIACFLLALVVYRFNKIILATFITTYLFINLSQISLSSPIGTPPELNYPKLNQVASAISSDSPINFNIAALQDFDTQAHPLRYLLQYVYKKTPQSIDQYSNIASLYVFTSSEERLKNPNVYELSSFYPYKIMLLKKIDNINSVYKLNK